MDSITHLALGAVIGEAMLGKSLGKKAMAIGAVAQSFPDIDAVASLWLPVSDDLLAHRGFTHSLLFVGLAAVFFALIAHRYYRGQPIKLTTWLLFFGLQIFIHIFLDTFNAYGTGWLEPFNNLRISFNILFVADPFFSLWVVMACGGLLIMRNSNPSRIRCVIFSLLISSGYLIYCAFNKFNIDSDVKRVLHDQQITYHRYFTTPTPFNNWLWYVVAEDDHGYYIGYRSVFDKQLFMSMEYFPRQDSLLLQAGDYNAVQKLRRFAQGYFTVEYRSGKLIFNDLRFGQQAGWHNPKAPFVFNYYLQHPEENAMVIQRGRMASWNAETFQSMIARIKGN